MAHHGAARRVIVDHGVFTRDPPPPSAIQGFIYKGSGQHASRERIGPEVQEIILTQAELSRSADNTVRIRGLSRSPMRGEHREAAKDGVAPCAVQPAVHHKTDGVFGQGPKINVLTAHMLVCKEPSEQD